MSKNISLCMIVKNEENNLRRCLESVKDFVGEIIVADTGSSDKTKELAADLGARVYDCNPTTHPELFFKDDEETLAKFGAPPPFSGAMCLGNFAGARNFSFSKATKDYLMWLDADDVLLGAHLIPSAVESMEKALLEVAWFPYHYAHDDKGRVACHLWRERIIRKGVGSAWVNPVHEVIVPLRAERSIRIPELIVEHHRPAERTAVVAHRNYKILAQHISTNPGDARTLFYFGNEARWIDLPKAIDAYEKYVDLSGWNEERSIARVYLGDIYMSQGKTSQAYAQFAAATMDLPHFPDGWFGLAQIAYHKKAWDDCIRFTEEGLKRGTPESVIMINPMTRLHLPHLYYNVALNSVGRVEEALASCNKGLEAVPEDKYLLFNRDVYVKFLEDKTDPVKIALASPRTPQPIKDAIEKVLKELAAPPRIDGPEGKKSIVIWTGPAVEWWSPASPNKTGIGGSETACIEMGKHLAAMGHKVIVYADCPHMDGIYDGVEYKHFGSFGGIDCDVFISSRQAQVMEHEVRAKAKFLWVHDIHCGNPDPNMHKWLLRFDRFLCLTNWHKGFFLNAYRFIHPSSVIVTRNGIDASRFAEEPVKKENRLIYSSSPNRGLDVMLDLFPKIKSVVSDAELHVCYGFESWERAVVMTQNETERQQIQHYRKRLAETPGVIWRGRLPQTELAEEFAKAKVWSYPTNFTETYCVTALEAQAARCVPVTTDLAALKETVHSGMMLKPTNTDPEYQSDFVACVIRLLKDEELRAPMAEAGRQWAIQKTWGSLATEWDAMFDQVAGEMKEQIVPRYEGMVGKPQF